jgi:hypothetical protein
MQGESRRIPQRELSDASALKGAWVAIRNRRQEIRWGWRATVGRVLALVTAEALAACNQMPSYCYRMTLSRSALLMAAVAVALCGCERGGSRAGDGIPALVEKMASAPIAADGRIHYRAAGRFSVKSDTAFCTFSPGGFGEQLNAALIRMGQNPYYAGSVRTHQAQISEMCIPNRSVFINAVETPNRQGGRYKMIFAVWQGDAAWVGAIERLNGVRPEFESSRPFRDGLPPLTPWAQDGRDREDRDYRVNLSTERDMADLSQEALNQILNIRNAR